MTVTLPQNQLPLTTDDIRWFLRDTPEHNIILPGGIEFTDDDIQRAIRFTTSKYNAMTPMTQVPSSSLNEYMLLCGVCAMLLRSEGIRQNRNELRAQDGNIAPVNLDEKQAQYSAWADRMQQEFEVHARNIKTQINMESVYGHISSGYRYIGRYTI
jgi:membrane-bound lytic murein transglycosylase B